MVTERDTVSLEDLVYGEMIQTEVLARLLLNKGILAKEELLQEVREVSLEQQAKQGGPGGES